MILARRLAVADCCRLPTVYRNRGTLSLGQQVLTIISERLPIERIQLRPHCSIGVAMFYGDLTAEQLYSRAISAAFTARHKGKKIRFSSLICSRWKPPRSG